jgi:hypothetical protein
MTRFILALAAITLALVAGAADAVTCSSPPTGSCLAWATDCEIASSTDDSYVRDAYEAVVGRGVDWIGTIGTDNPSQQYEVNIEASSSSDYPTCLYGGRIESKMNAIYSTYDDGWHLLDGVLLEGPYQYVEEVHIKRYGDGVAQVNVVSPTPDCSVGSNINVTGNFIEEIYDDAIEKDRMGAANIQNNYIKTYKTAFAARPIQACEESIDSSTLTWVVKNQLVEMVSSSLVGDAALGCGSIGGDGHGYPWKWPTVDQGDIGPKQAVVNNVFLMADVYHECFGGQVYPLLDKIVTTGVNSCKGNVILWAGYATDDGDQDWESLMDEDGTGIGLGEGPDGYDDGDRNAALNGVTFNGASTPCYRVVAGEDLEACAEETPDTPGMVACLKAADLSQLAHLCPGGTACSWDDLVSQWQSAHTSDTE